jgi:hypothetical protein
MNERRKRKREKKLTDVFYGSITEMPYRFVSYKVSLTFYMLHHNCHKRPIWEGIHFTQGSSFLIAAFMLSHKSISSLDEIHI